MKPLFFLLAGIIFITASCNSSHEYEIKATDKYEKAKESLGETEQKNPAKFLTVSGNNKRNLLGQTVIKGSVTNKATVATYKDVDIKLSFYSKTGALLEEDHEVVYESINPGATTNFKSKYFAPKGTDSVAMHIVGAKY
ncbi:MAG: hypothetical protein ABIP30_01370 [Ferruginibacter sp.]